MGQELLQHDEIGEELVHYHQKILEEPGTNQNQAISSIKTNIPKLLNNSQNDALMRTITIQELDQAMQDT